MSTAAPIIVTWVGQRAPDECIVAALSMASGVTYEYVLDYWKRQGWEKPSASGGTRSALAFMSDLGWFMRQVYTTSQTTDGVWPPTPFAPVHLALVENPGGGHMVCMDGYGVVYDPLTADIKHLTDWPVVNQVMGFVRPE